MLGPATVKIVDPLGPGDAVAVPAMRTEYVAPVFMFSRVTSLEPASSTARGPTWIGLPASLSMVAPTLNPRQLLKTKSWALAGAAAAPTAMVATATEVAARM